MKEKKNTNTHTTFHQDDFLVCNRSNGKWIKRKTKETKKEKETQKRNTMLIIKVLVTIDK
jgi:hypothetical protein